MSSANFCKGYQQTTKVSASKERVNIGTLSIIVVVLSKLSVNYLRASIINYSLDDTVNYSDDDAITRWMVQ